MEFVWINETKNRLINNSTMCHCCSRLTTPESINLDKGIRCHCHSSEILTDEKCDVVFLACGDFKPDVE